MMGFLRKEKHPSYPGKFFLLPLLELEITIVEKVF